MRRGKKGESVHEVRYHAYMVDDAQTSGLRKKRVTLTLNPAVHAEAKRIAKLRGLSFSSLVEALLAGQHEPTAEEWLASLKVDPSRIEAPAPGEDPLYDAIWAKHGSGPHPGARHQGEEAA